MRKMVQNNLIKNSIAAYLAAVEIHNKPNVAYRYETVTLLMINAWELALKAYVKKNIRKYSIYTKSGNTISFDKALDYVNENVNSKHSNSFVAVKENLLCIEEYRNQITHFYCDELEPYIFMLVAKAALNYVDFMSCYFDKNVMESDGLFIMPLGFKLPFRPEDFLTKNVAKYASSPKAQEFISRVVNVIVDLKSKGIEDSIVLGFGLYLENVRKLKNSDIIAALSQENSAVPFSKKTKIDISKEANQIVNLSDEEFRQLWPYSYGDLIAWCRENIASFKQTRQFFEVKRRVETEPQYMYERRLDTNNPKSPSKKFYSKEGLLEIKRLYEEQIESEEERIINSR